MAKYSLSWDGYRNNICGGFSSLQQNGEFVDMTLAADGHFVKVHQVLMALVSPYLKELITSAPCQHPVIYLNNVSFEVLTALLEYVYTGEVLLPPEHLKLFIQTAKNLHIRGLEEFNKDDQDVKDFGTLQNEDDVQLSHLTGRKRLSREPDSTEIEVDLPPNAQKVVIKGERKGSSQSTPKKRRKQPEEISDSFMDDSAAQDDDDFNNESFDDSQITTDAQSKYSSSNLQYSVSIRGSIQVILNRYIYNLHSTQNRTGMRRWRCIEYRNQRCMAFVVTKGNVILNRANPHNHAFHDKKIIQKIEKNAVFSALEDVESYQEKEKEKESSAELSVDQQSYGNMAFIEVSEK